jgi:hypothetical protein
LDRDTKIWAQAESTEEIRGEPSGASSRQGERERKKMTAASVEGRKTSSSRPGLRRSAVACTVEGGLDSREGREKAHRRRGETIR